MIREHPSSSKMILFHSIIVYLLHTIKKLKSGKNKYHKRTNKISYLEAPLLIRIIRPKTPFKHRRILSVFERLDRRSDGLRARRTRRKLGPEERKPGTTNRGGLTANKESDRRGQSARSSSKPMGDRSSCRCNRLYCRSSSKPMGNRGRCRCNWLYFKTNLCIPI